MAEISEITDRESLAAWLKALPFEEEEARRVAVTIAHRASMRVLPVYWHWALENRDGKGSLNPALHVLRVCLIAGVGSARPSPDVSTAAEHASAAERAPLVFFPSPAVKPAAEAAVRSISGAAGVVISGQPQEVASNVVRDAAENVGTDLSLVGNLMSLSNLSTGVTPEIWAATQSDCAALKDGWVPLDRTPLWPGGNPFEKLWQDIRSALPEGWEFWRDWYQKALDGVPPNWGMLEEIALIDPEDWDKGPDHVNRLIAEIQLKYAVAATPNAEEIIVNDDGLFEAVPRSQLPPKTLADVQDRLRDVIADIRRAQQQENNQYHPLVAEADLLDSVLARYPDNTLRLYEACLKVVIHVTRNVANGVLPENDNLVGDVTGDVQNSADDIYNFDPEVRETVDARAKLRFERLSDEQKAEVARLAEAAAQSSVQKLADELREDAAVVQKEGEPDEETKPDRYRLGSRLAKILVRGVINVSEALIIVGGVGGGITVMARIIRLLLGL